MAEIKIEKKKAIWPWILGGIIVAGLIVYFMFIRPGDDNKNTTYQDTVEQADPVVENDNTPVATFIAYVNGDTSTMTLDHEYTHTALINLADASQYMADKTGYDANGNIEQAREYADKITQDPDATTHADNIRRSTRLLANVLQDIQQKSFSQLTDEAAALKTSAQAIDTEELTLDQRNTVKTFFKDAADLLEKMN